MEKIVQLKPSRRAKYIAWLEDIMEHSSSDTARVAAAHLLLKEDDRAAPAQNTSVTIKLKPIGEEAETA